MSFCWQLKSLMKKNFIMMKRNPCVACCEIFFPLILMIFIALIRRAFTIKETNLNFTDEEFIKNNATAYINLDDKVQINKNTNSSEIQRVGNISLDYEGIPLRYPL
jgi:hypothetical protein